MTRNLHKDSLIPPYMAYPRFLLTMDISETAKLVYVLMLDRARLSMKNEGWEDENGHVFIHYTIGALAEATGKCKMTIKDALNKLELHGLIYRQRVVFSALLQGHVLHCKGCYGCLLQDCFRKVQTTA